MRRNRGFTLFEVLICVSIMLVISGSMFGFFRAFEVRSAEEHRRGWTSFESERVSRSLSRDVQGAATVTGGGTELSLSSGGTDPIRYRFAGGTLLRKAGDREESLAHGLSEASFKVEGPAVRLHCVFTDDQPLAVRHQTEDYVAVSRLGGVR